MAKRIIIVSSLPVCIVLGVMALIFFGIGKGQAESSVSIENARTQLIEMANADKAAEVDTAIDKFTADYARNAELPSNLVVIADSLAWKRLYAQSDRLYRLTMDLALNNTSLAS